MHLHWTSFHILEERTLHSSLGLHADSFFFLPETVKLVFSSGFISRCTISRTFSSILRSSQLPSEEKTHLLYRNWLLVSNWNYFLQVNTYMYWNIPERISQRVQ